MDEFTFLCNGSKESEIETFIYRRYFPKKQKRNRDDKTCYPAMAFVSRQNK